MNQQFAGSSVEIEYANSGGVPASRNGKQPHVEDSNVELVYDDAEHEPVLHRRTWMALCAMFLLNLVTAFAIFSPPAVVGSTSSPIFDQDFDRVDQLSIIAKDLNGQATETWAQNALLLVQTVLSPLVCSVSDIFQVRKNLMVGTVLVALVGACIAPGSHNINRLIAAQALIGVGFAALPLGYSVPSEITPRRWRPIVQGWMNIGNAVGAIVGPLVIGALTKNTKEGWRTFYWIEVGMWAICALGIFVAYQPPKRHTRLDHLSHWQKLRQLDLIGYVLIASGLGLLLTGMNLGGGLFAWSNARVLVTLILGIVILIAFGLYEWKGTKTGILHHDFFRENSDSGVQNSGRRLLLATLLIIIEGALVFAFVIFYPILTQALFETDPFLLVLRGLAFWIACLLSTLLWVHASHRLRSVRGLLCLSLTMWTAALVAFATIQPDDNVSAVAFAALAGIAQGGLLSLIVVAVQLATPHHLIGTVSALTVSCRSVGAVVFSAIYSTAFSNRLSSKLPTYIAAAALKAGLPQSSLDRFIKDLAKNEFSDLPKVPGVNQEIISAGITSLKQAFADSIRIVFIIAAPVAAVGVILCLFLGDFKKTMNYIVDAPIEVLTSKASNVEKSTELNEKA